MPLRKTSIHFQRQPPFVIILPRKMGFKYFLDNVSA
jgi:hypothetical protein